MLTPTTSGERASAQTDSLLCNLAAASTPVVIALAVLWSESLLGNRQALLRHALKHLAEDALSRTNWKAVAPGLVTAEVPAADSTPPSSLNRHIRGSESGKSFGRLMLLRFTELHF